MKKICLLLALLLVCSLALCACQKNGDQESPTGDGTTGETKEPLPPEAIVGIWYSSTNQTVLDITKLDEITLYVLKAGYYEYDTKETAPCTYEDYILTMNREGEEPLTWIFDAQTGVLSADNGGDTSSYVRKETLPTQVQEVNFPDFSTLNCGQLVTLGPCTGLTPSEDTLPQVAIEIFENFYKNTKEEDIPKITGRVAQRGDYVNIDYAGYLNGVAFDNGSATNVPLALIEESGYIPGFAESVIGLEIGKTYDANITFPENYGNAELAGKEVVFKMTLNAIYDLVIPDDKIAELTENKFSTYQDYLADLAKDAYISDLWEQVKKATTTTAEVPEAAYLYFLQYYRDMYHYYAYYYGMDYEAFIKMYGITEEMFIEEAKAIALDYIIAYAIAEANQITYTQEDYDSLLKEFVETIKESHGYSDAEATDYVLKEEIQTLYTELTYNAVMDWIVAQNLQDNQ